MINYEQNKNCFDLTKHIKSRLLFKGSKVSKKPFMTVFIPTYNRVELLKEAVQSVINQQKVDFPWNLLIVDNEPYDGKMNKTEKYIRTLKIKNVLYYRNEQMLRVGDNFNRGIYLSTSPWVMMLHDDDLLMRNTMQKVSTALHCLTKIAPKELGCLSTQYHQFKFDPQHPTAHKQELATLDEHYQHSPMLFKFWKCTHWNVLFTSFIGGDVPSNGTTYNRKAVMECGGFNDDLGISADQVLLYCMENKYSVYSTLEPYGFYRWGINSMSKPETTYRVIKDNFNFREYVFTKNCITKIWGMLFRDCLYYHFTKAVLGARKLVSSEFCDFATYNDIYSRLPKRWKYKIWRRLFFKTYISLKHKQSRHIARTIKKQIKQEATCRK